jgi:hypothetical protein
MDTMTRHLLQKLPLLAATALAGGALWMTPALAQQAGGDLSNVEQQIQDLQNQLKRLQQQLADEAKARAKAEAAAKAKAAQEKAEQAKVNAAAPGGGGGTSESASGMVPGAVVPVGQAMPPPAVPQQMPPNIAPPPAGGVNVNPIPPPISDEFGISTVPPPPGADSLASASPAILTQLAPGYSLRVGGLTITLGGYVEAATIWRSRNETAGINSNFNGAIPTPNEPGYYQHELTMDARQSRYAALVQGNVSNSISVAAYLEGDFLSTSPVANSIESSSYIPRWRLYYAQIDDADNGLHALFGESWSLATMFKTGMVPRQELIPIDPEAQYVVGFTWTRNMTLRMVKSFDDNIINVGLSAEAPQTNYYVGPNGTGVPGTTTYYYPGGVLYDPRTNYSLDAAPDVILKATYDPGFGHYELYGMGRFMEDRTSIGNGGSNHITPTGAIGGGALISVFDQALDLYSTFLAGDGIGRYTSAGLPDATIGPGGSVKPLPGAQVLVGVIGHPNDAIDTYLYLGREQVAGSSFAVNGKGYGYGSPLYSNAGCDIQNSTVCTANTSGVSEVSVGAWWRFLSGNSVGVFLVGPQYEFVRRDTFQGIGGAPKINEQIAILSFRFYPFQ